MALTRTFSCTKDNTSRPLLKTGQGASKYLLVGLGAVAPNKTVHRAFLDFSGFDSGAQWGTNDKIVAIELVITTGDTHNWSFGSTPKIKVGAIGSAWNEGNAPDGSWHTDDYVSVGGSGWQTFTLTKEEVDHISLDVTSLLENYAPKDVLRRDGQPSKGLTFNGVKIISYDETLAGLRVELMGRTATTAGNRPFIRVTYDVGPTKPNAPTLGAPSGAVPSGGGFNGTFTSPEVGDVLERVQVTVWDSAGTTQVGTTIDYQADEADRLSGTFSIPMPAWIKSGVNYKWTARVFDQTGTPSDYAVKKAFSLTSALPVVVLSVPSGALDTLKNCLFRAAYSDADLNPLKSFQYQVRLQTDESDPAWGDALLWDSGELAPASADTIEFTYGGPPLTADTAYSMRVRAMDSSGSMSEWDYGDFTLSAAYTPEGGEESYPDWYLGIDETAAAQMSGYSRVGSQYRLVLKAMGTNRAPGAVTAIITDASNLGASKYANSAGEMYFTLPSTHPQVGACEPYQTHYSIQKYVGDQWIEKFAGILDDFDATENEVVFHGLDYLGLLNLSVDERKDGTKAAVMTNPNEGTGGSKYSETAISTIIRDQLFQGKKQANSTYAFISIPANPSADWSAMAELVSLATPYASTMGTIAGLLESHKAGTGRRSRIMVTRTAENAYKWQLFDNYGKDRPDIRLEYGGLVNGYRLVGFGDFGTVVLGLGRAREGVSVLYANASTTQQVYVNGVLTPAVEVFGRISKPAMWQDLYDQNDLKRRVTERAQTYGKIGKRVALALRVNGLGPFDGFDIYDNVPVVINRGPVQTDRYGSSLWTIHGVAWKLYPDGHEDMTLTVLPKQDGSAISEDIVGSTPILDQTDWEIRRVPPDPLTPGKWYLDQSTGLAYHWDTDLEEWVVQNPLELLGKPVTPTVGTVVVQGVLNLEVTL